MKRSCIFCKSNDAPMTKEHVFPDWLAKFYGRSTPSHTVVTFPNGQSEARPIKLFQQQLKSVCELCNGGWMSNLERFASGGLKKIITSGQPATLTAADSANIAIWIVKTTLVMGFDNKQERPVIKRSLYDEFYKNKAIPKGSTIYLSRREDFNHNGKKLIASFALKQKPSLDFIPVELASQIQAEIAEGATMIGSTLVIGNLVCQFLYNDFKSVNVNPILDEKYFIEVSPRNSSFIWPSTSAIDEIGGFEALHAAI